MSIVYPLARPDRGVASMRYTARTASAYSASPFTYAGQAQNWGGQALRVEITLPPMERDVAEDWIAFLLSLDGHKGTFLMAPDEALSSLGIGGGAPIVAGAGQAGNTLAIGGAPVSLNGWLRRGDYVQIGSAGNAHLHKVLRDVDTDAAGLASLVLWPNLRLPPDDAAPIEIDAPQGRWRLENPNVSWDINTAIHYGLSFEAMEALP